MISKRQWHVSDKWKRHLALVRNLRVARHIPPTRLLGRKRLGEYLKRYKVVFVKPVYGSFGNNIMKVTKVKRTYLVQREQRIRHVPQDRISSVVLQHAGGRPFLLQRGIQLLKIKGQPIDFRLLLLRPEREWRAMGIMGKVAGGNRIVTNFNHGGHPIGFEEALRAAGMGKADSKRIRGEMFQVGMAAARTFSSRYKHCRRMGIDFAIDLQGRLWIIEVNTNPYYDLFRHHRNRGLHRTIDQITKRIGKGQARR